ncbi:MAG TPA: glycosyltransferase family 39 protein [Candidatus Sulfotelmatobacter sp.]|nr:glycosyltransferase family 39 protein [Candidatus Sulfotelmatobacter sp.]
MPMQRSTVLTLRDRLQQNLDKHFPAFVSIFVCLYILFGLFAFLYLQGDMNDWYAFMRNDAHVVLFATYFLTGIVGSALIVLLRKGPNLLNAPKRILTVSFFVMIIVGLAAFTYLNIYATQDNYSWMNDGLVYQRIAQSFLTYHEFLQDGIFTHHFGPVYPVYLSLFYFFLPVDLGTRIAAEISFIAAIVVVFVITKRMYGETSALVTTGLIATIPSYVFAVSRNFAEPIVIVFYVLTLYFILESLKAQKENRIIVAGLTAALGFLVKSSVGYFFIIAGLSGFLWRFYYMRWNVFRNKNYALAIVVFFSLLGTWTLRNIYHFWDGTFEGLIFAIQPSEYMYRATLYTFSLDFGGFFLELLFFGVFLAFFMLAYSWFFADYLKASMRRIQNERVSCLLLSVMLTVVVGLIVTSVNFIYETSWEPLFFLSYFPQSQMRYFISNMVRYCFISIIPLTWFAYESTKKFIIENHTSKEVIGG